MARASLKFIVAAVLIALALSGCDKPGSGAADSLDSALAKLSADAVVDLDAAQVIAVAANDEIAMACYPTLKDFLIAKLGTAQPTVGQIRGVFSGFETARVTRMKIESGAGGPVLPVKLKLACAALVQDERQFALRLAVMIGGASVGAPGVSGLLPK